MQNELMEAMKTATFYEADNPLSYADEGHANATMMEHESNVQEQRQSRSSVATDFDGLPLFVVSDVCTEIVLSINYELFLLSFLLRRLD